MTDLFPCFPRLTLPTLPVRPAITRPTAVPCSPHVEKAQESKLEGSAMHTMILPSSPSTDWSMVVSGPEPGSVKAARRHRIRHRQVLRHGGREGLHGGYVLPILEQYCTRFCANAHPEVAVSSPCTPEFDSIPSIHQ